jgi:hypothetical protein
MLLRRDTGLGGARRGREVGCTAADDDDATDGRKRGLARKEGDPQIPHSPQLEEEEETKGDEDPLVGLEGGATLKAGPGAPPYPYRPLSQNGHQPSTHSHSEPSDRFVKT